MRRRDIRRANHNFMLGIIGMAVVVMMVVAVFWFWCLKCVIFRAISANYSGKSIFFHF